MKIFKSWFGKPEPTEVKIDKVQVETEALAQAIAKAVATEMAKVLKGLSFTPSGHGGYNPSDVSIDERVVDVGVSTEGLKKGTDAPLAEGVKTDDDVSGSLDKLKKLKRK